MDASYNRYTLPNSTKRTKFPLSLVSTYGKFHYTHKLNLGSGTKETGKLLK